MPTAYRFHHRRQGAPCRTNAKLCEQGAPSFWGNTHKACDILGEIGRRKAGRPKAGVVGDLAFLIDHPNDDVVQCLATTLGRYREPAGGTTGGGWSLGRP